MKDNVVIKSYKKGIALHLNDEVDFDIILQEIAYRFSEARDFFGKSVMALSIEGRKVSDTEEIRILEAIRENSDMKISCIVGKDDDEEKIFIKASEEMEKKLSGGENGQFFKRSLKESDVLETDTSIIILGDVEAGCAVISPKNIIILGTLRGEAYAGGNGKDGAFVAALEMEPERIKIGDFKYKPIQKKSAWGKRTKAQPKIAVVKNRQIVLAPFTKDLLNLF